MRVVEQDPNQFREAAHGTNARKKETGCAGCEERDETDALKIQSVGRRGQWSGGSSRAQRTIVCSHA